MITPVKYSETLKKDILSRRESDAAYAENAVKEIIRNVKERGDKALYEYTRMFDKAELSSLKVSEEELRAALSSVDEEYLNILKAAAENIAAFHKKQLASGFELRENGKILGQKVTPLACAGIYVPGGTAAYPSTVLMNAVPAKVAGVEKIVMVTPPDQNGNIKAEVLAAAAIAGVSEIYKIGGAQAIAALAYGTESVPKADKITGPGNIFVATAKRQVYGACGIDMIAGPSEILIIADGGAKAKLVAADMLSQAEHDKLAAAVLVTDSGRLAEEVAKELERQVGLLPRAEIAEASLKNNGKIILTKDLAEAAAVSDALAPEHLELCVKEPFVLLDKIRNAGSVFLGYNTPEAAGDYFAGTNHTLPTGGSARFSSALGANDFVKTVQYICYDESALRREGDAIVKFARSEGLDAHAESVKARLQDE
ncbi:MAG: histidinol dehydrogenase [Bacillota bacterium]|nr:MAG: histidinol dehydrogenase [Bacillota bacterium]